MDILKAQLLKVFILIQVIFSFVKLKCKTTKSILNIQIYLIRINITAVEKYKYDGILVDIDTVTLAGAVAIPVDFPQK